MNQCPFFNLCGGCKYDFSDENYQSEKLKQLPKIEFTDSPIWGGVGCRRRAEFAFCNGKFGFYKKQSKDIVDIKVMDYQHHGKISFPIAQ